MATGHVGLIGYLRVSSEAQDTRLQRDALTEAGALKFFQDKISSRKTGLEGFGTKSGARACFCWLKGLLPDVQYDGRFGQPGNPTRP